MDEVNACPQAACPQAVSLAEILIQTFSSRCKTIVLAESCTAGLAADLLAQIPGVSRVLWGAYVCYTIEAKISMLGLDRRRLLHFGLVSRETACDMASAALEKSGANMAAAVTGLAGPGGDGGTAPVGAVWVAVAAQGAGIVSAKQFHFTGPRNETRFKAALAALEALLEASLLQ